MKTFEETKNELRRIRPKVLFNFPLTQREKALWTLFSGLLEG